jgi:hypothetical protein
VLAREILAAPSELMGAARVIRYYVAPTIRGHWEVWEVQTLEGREPRVCMVSDCTTERQAQDTADELNAQLQLREEMLRRG